MKKPVVDYRQFRPSKLNEPEFKHLKLLGGWLIYFVLYFITENLIPAENCTSMHMFLDDIIPFCEWFVFPYIFWYGLIVFSLGYFALYKIEAFCQLQKYIFITQMIAMAIYIIFPSRQDLRPEYFVNDNLMTRIIGIIYAFDTNTGVCPSLHVAYSMGIASVWLKQRDVKIIWKALLIIAVALICLATMFIKQHSACDFFAALPVCFVAEMLVFHWKPRKNIA